MLRGKEGGWEREAVGGERHRQRMGGRERERGDAALHHPITSVDPVPVARRGAGKHSGGCGFRRRAPQLDLAAEAKIETRGSGRVEKRKSPAGVDFCHPLLTAQQVI